MRSGESPNAPDVYFRWLLDSVSDVVWVRSAESGEQLYTNGGFEKVYGRDPDELHRDPELWLEVVHPEDRAIAEGSVRDLERNGVAFATYRIVRPDGEVRWIRDHKVRETGEGAGEALLGGVAHDITEHKRAEMLSEMQQAVLRAVATREDHRAILDTLCQRIDGMVPDSVATILLLDEERRLRVAAAPGCSEELVAAFDGLVPGNNVGSCGTAAYTGQACIVHDTQTDPRWESLRESAAHFGIRSCWSIPILSQGKCVVGTFAISGFVPRSPNDFHDRLLETATQLANITLQHERDRQELLAAKESAEAATRAKSELLANVSHELRTPLTAILGFSDVLIAEEAVRSRRDNLQVINDNGKHLLKVINDLLDISKIEAGELEVERFPCVPRQILADTITLFEHTIRERGLGLHVENADSLPQSVLADPTRLRQILVNLMSNAVKFTQEGKIEIRCRSTRIDDREIRLEIAVADSGIGIAPEQMARIFTPFNQADASMTRRFGGTGLGLSLSHRLATMLGGDLTAQSERGRGSTFTLSIVGKLPDLAPVAEEAFADEAGDSGASLGSSAPQPGLRCRALVAEDTPALRRLAEFVLGRAGAEVVVVEDGETACRTALEAEATKPFDVIFMDMHMPVMDGYEATRTLREQGYQRPIVAMTARAQTGDREKCLKAGCDAYLSKPLQPDELVRLVTELTTGES